MTVHETAVVSPGAQIGEGAEIGPYCVIGPRVTIGAGTRVMSHAVVDGWTSVGSGCSIFPFASVGTQTQDLKYAGAETRVEIGDGTTIREYVTINAGTSEGEVTRIGSRCLLMAYAHVAHTCIIGDEVIMANCATLGGHIVVEDQAILGGLSAVHQFVRIGRMAMVGGCTKVTRDCPPFMLVDGQPARVHGPNTVGLRGRGVAAEVRGRIKQVYRILYRKGLSVSQALAEIRKSLGGRPEVEEVVSFVESSKRGIVK